MKNPCADSGVDCFRLARAAMGTRFEIVLPTGGAEESWLRSCAELALDEIEEWDRQLSLFRKDSFLSLINREAAVRPVPVTPEIFELLRACVEIWERSHGLFDVTVDSCSTEPGELSDPPILLSEKDLTVTFPLNSTRVDLGGIGKGFALDRSAEILREEGVTQAFLHGGTSTMVALGSSPTGSSWKIAVRDPRRDESESLGTFSLRDGALSVSAPHGGKVFREGSYQSHLLHPERRHGGVESGLAAVLSPLAMVADAWSTALVLAGKERARELFLRANGLSMALVLGETGEPLVLGERHLQNG